VKPSIYTLLCVAVLLVSGCANIGKPHPVALSSGGLHFKKPVKTWKDFLEQNIVMQQFDYSCGAAALATLMQHYFQDDVTEKDILEDIVNQLNDKDFKNRKKEGLSLLDLKQFAQRRGYQAVGVKLKFAALPKLRGPVLVYLETSEYKHFAILRGIKEDRVFLADPSRGNIRMSAFEFAKEWPGIALVLGKKGFGTPSEHSLAIQEKSPILNELMAARRELYIKTLNTRF
jgi:predicted double-glycine peptidase